MKFFSNWYITTKLLLINLVIFLIIGGVIVVVFFSFSNIEQMMTTIVNRDVSQVIENARIGRGLTGVFADTSHLIDRFLDQEDLLQTEGDRLVETTTALVTRGTDPRLGESLQAFIQKLQALLEQGAIISKMSQELNATDQELVSNLEDLEELLANTIIVVRMEGRDVSDLERIHLDIPWYREALLRVSISLYRVVQKHLRVALTDEEVGKSILQLLVLLDELDAKLQPLTTSEPDIKAFGQQFVNTVRSYKETIAALYRELTTFQQQLNTMNEAQQQVLTVLEEIDAQIVRTTGNMQKNTAGVMQSSRGFIVVLSGVIIVVMALGWLSMRWMIRPLLYLSRIADQLADGDIECNIVDIRAHDEIGMLSRAFRKLIMYFQEMARTVTEISQGNLELEVKARSKEDVLGNGFQQMIVYLKEMGKFATHAARGDLRSQITLRSQTDQLGNAFVHMKEGLIALIAEIRSGADHIASISAQVLSTSSKNAETLEQIGNTAEVTSSAMQEVSSSAEEVRMNTEHLSSSVEETTASISQMISSIRHVAENSRKLSGFADDTRTTMTNMVNSLETVVNQAELSKMLAETTAQDAVSGQESVKQMMSRMTAISEVTENISQIISHLESRSLEIGTILDVINEVADQTSLLALNASIIAAQAGVHGRGFAVVADEIKELATRVGTSTKEIAEIIKSVQRDSSDAVSAIGQGQREVESGVMVAREAGEALKKIGQSAENSSGVAAEIAVLVRQQTTTNSQVVESIQDVTNMVNEITRATQEQEKNSSQLFSMVENMQALAAQVMRATQEQQQSTLRVTEFMEEVIISVNENVPTVKELARSANELATQADVLKQQVERFILPA